MKLASLKHKRDGRLLVVNKELNKAILVKDIAMTMQEAIDNWEVCFPLLKEVYIKLNRSSIPGEFLLKSEDLAAPLPRGYQWVDGSAYLSHVELVRKARGASMPDNFYFDPLMYQGAGDIFLGPTDPIFAFSEDFGIDFESEVGVITKDVPMGISEKDALNYILLFVLINDISLRNIIPKELEKGFGFFHGKPHTALSPVAILPEELEDSYYLGKVHLPLITRLNKEVFGTPNAGVDMNFNFAKLIAHAAKTRSLGAGTLIGSGTVSNKDENVGSSCIVEKRMREKILYGEAKTPFLKDGDEVCIEMLDKSGKSLFGKIEQKVKVGSSI